MGRSNYWTRQLPRRRLLAGGTTAALGAAAWALTGCSDSDDDDGEDATPTGGGGTRPGTPTAPTPTTAGEVINKDGINKVRQSAIFATINPYAGLDSGLTWGFTVFDHLWYVPLDTGIRENFLATNIEQQDATHFTVTIGESFFHDKPPINGRPVKAQDIKASFESAAKQTKISNTSWWTEVLDTITTPDEKTLNFTLKKVDAWTFSSSNAGSPIGSSILPQEIAADPSFMDRDLIGSGRYQFVSHENGTNFKLKRNEKWRVPGEPYLAGVEYKLIQEQAAALAAFSAQEIYSVGFNNRLEREDMEKKHGKEINVEAEETRVVWVLLCRGDGQWADPRVPQAFSLALDRQEMINLMNFGEGRISGPVPPAFGEALPEKEILDTWGKHDPAEAKKQLAATAFDTSKEYSFKYPVLGDRYQQFATIAKSQLEKTLGLKIKLVPEEFGRWLSQSLYGSDFDGFQGFTSLSYDDPTSYIAIYTKLYGGRPNWAGWKNDELDAAVNAQKAILDDRERLKAVQEIQRKAWKAGAPFIPTFVAVGSGASWGFVKGRVTGRGSYGAFNGKVYIDKK
jgi:peptide/nickel transport system substrate-binding protein